MHGYMAVVKRPTAVSDETGSFTINNVTARDLHLTAWREIYGAQTQNVTVGTGRKHSTSPHCLGSGAAPCPADLLGFESKIGGC
jgi:hypothetical protein